MSFAPPKPTFERQRREDGRRRDRNQQKEQGGKNASSTSTSTSTTMSTYYTESGRRPLGLPEVDDRLPALNPAPFYDTSRGVAYQNVLPSTKFTKGYRFHRIGKDLLSNAHLNKLNRGLFSPGPKYVLPSTFMPTARQKPMPGNKKYITKAGLHQVQPRYHLHPRTGEFLFPPNEWSDGGIIQPISSSTLRRRVKHDATALEMESSSYRPRSRQSPARPRSTKQRQEELERKQHESSRQFNPAFPYSNALELEQRNPSTLQISRATSAAAQSRSMSRQRRSATPSRREQQMQPRSGNVGTTDPDATLLPSAFPYGNADAAGERVNQSVVAAY